MNETPQNLPVAPLLRFADVLAQVRADADAANHAKTTGIPLGPLTGLPRLDKEIGYCLNPGLHGLHGNAGAGKTAFALQIATSCQCPALYITCEMAPAELLRRHAARVTKTYLGRFKSGELTGEAIEALALKAIEAAPLAAFMDATLAPAPVAHIQAAALAVKGEAPHILIVVDSLQSWTEGGGGDATEYETLNAGVKALRGLAHSLKCPVLFISERNRDSMKSGGLNAGAGTRKIEYGAETVFDLDRDMTAQHDGAGEFEITLRLPKNRHGTVGREIPLMFSGALQTFRELDTREAVNRASERNGSTKAAGRR